MNLPVCPLMQDEETGVTGWQLTSVTYEETVQIQHCVPRADLRLHQLDPSCWCQPVEDAKQPDLWAHNSADGREAYETGRPVQ